MFDDPVPSRRPRRSTWRRTRRIAVAVALTVAGAAACGDEADQDPTPVDDPGSSSTVDPSGRDTTGGTVGGTDDLPEGTEDGGGGGDDGADTGDGPASGTPDGRDGGDENHDRGPAPGGDHRPNPGAPDGPPEPVD